MPYISQWHEEVGIHLHVYQSYGLPCAIKQGTFSGKWPFHNVKLYLVSVIDISQGIISRRKCAITRSPPDIWRGKLEWCFNAQDTRTNHGAQCDNNTQLQRKIGFPTLVLPSQLKLGTNTFDTVDNAGSRAVLWIPVYFNWPSNAKIEKYRIWTL